MALKYASGAQCLYQGISFLIWGNFDQILTEVHGAYYIGIAVFFVLTMAFSFGDIEKTRVMQAFVVVFRFVVILCMFGGTIGSISKNGAIPGQVWDWKKQKTALANVFGNTVFTYLYQPAVPGIIYPVRPQRNLQHIFLISNVIATVVLFLEA